jgi:uncharacterized membrane-anchored protein YhcB (DUF1043 family)
LEPEWGAADMTTLLGILYYSIPGIVIGVGVGYVVARLVKDRLPPQQ